MATYSDAEPIFPITEERSSYWRSIWALSMPTTSVPHQTFSTQGNSGNAHILNVGGDHITDINDAFSADTYTVLESIEERLKLVQDNDLGMSNSEIMDSVCD